MAKLESVFGRYEERIPGDNIHLLQNLMDGLIFDKRAFSYFCNQFRESCNLCNQPENTFFKDE